MNTRQQVRQLFRATVRPVANLRPRHPNRREILLACNNSITAQYLRDVWELLRDDKRLGFYFTMALPEDRAGVQAEIRKLLAVQQVHPRWAHVRRWDLIIMADHAFSGLADMRRCPVVRIPHGICGGKLINAEQVDYRYGSFAVDSNGRPRYTRIFESSELNRDRIVASNPAFKDVIAVVGSLTADKLSAQVQHRDRIRRQMGYKAEDIVVFVMSTWGANCLFQTMGDDILAEAAKLQKEFKFILSIHPHEYRPKLPGQRVWGEYLRTQRKHGFVVREPGENWMDCMAACDVMLSDATSLATYGALAGKPAVFVPMPDNFFEPGSFLRRLRRMSPILNNDGDLRRCLLKAKYEYPFDKLQEMAGQINSYPGQSHERIRREIYQLIKLSQQVN